MLAQLARDIALVLTQLGGDVREETVGREAAGKVRNGITCYLLAFSLACCVHTYLLTYVPVRGGEEDIASAQAVHVDDGVGGQLHLLLEAEAPRRLSSEYLVST